MIRTPAFQRSLALMRTVVSYRSMSNAAAATASKVAGLDQSAALVSYLERSHPKKTKTQYGKPFSPRKQFLFSEYEKHFVESPSLIVLQHHNLSGKELADQRKELKIGAQGARLMIVRSKMLVAVLRNTKYTNMRHLFTGPAAFVYWESAGLPEGFDSILAMKQAMKVVSAQRKLILMGAKYDDILLNPTTMKDFVNIPPIDQLRGQVIGTIQAPIQQLHSIIKRVPQRLTGVLTQRAQGEGTESD